ncbi:MAG: hypothetical protein FK732_09980 [Asgard group archaeon]|nr:hypothetical protein [Asgard group archaeon]
MGLKQTYDKIERYSKEKDIEIDSYKVIQEVERLRNYWKPNNIKVVLLAESHVLTNDDDFRIKIDYSDYSNFIPNYPDGFVRFVYCIGYSESSLFKNKHSDPFFKNPGTRQFWKIFCACTSKSEKIEYDTILKGKTKNIEQRVKNKIQILRKMKKKGIWLVDGSIVGINGLPTKIKRDIISLSWNNYIKDIVIESKPKAIITIGSPIKNVLVNEFQDTSLNLFHQPQPQARLSSQEHKEVLRRYFRICSTF